MSLLAKSLQRSAPQRRTEAYVVPGTFLGFLESLRVVPSDGQAELIRVAFDGTEPVDRDLARAIFGCDVSVGIRRVVAAVCGARSGKSYLLVALRLVWGMLMRDLSSMAPGQRAVAMIVAPNEKHRREVLNYALGAIHSKPELEAMLLRETDKGFELRRQDGKLVYFDVGVASAKGADAAGKSLTDYAMDETMLFRDASYKVNDVDLFRAGATRVLPGGQVIVASTPWAQAGLLWELYRDNFGKDSDSNGTIVAHAPTLTMNPSPTVRAIVETETKRDADNAAREYEAKFLTGGTTLFFESATIDAALVDAEFIELPYEGDMIVAGADFGFRSDSSALVMVALRGDVAHVFAGAEERPSADAPLKPSQTVKRFAQVMGGRCKYLMADQHYREAIAEHLETYNVAYVPAPARPAEAYVRARMMLREGKVRIHGLEFRERLVQQMREVHGKPTSGGGMSIVHPRWATGGHGDLVAALVLALWQVHGDVVPAKAPEIGTAEWEAAQKKARYERFKNEAERPHWIAKGGTQNRGRMVGGRRTW